MKAETLELANRIQKIVKFLAKNLTKFNVVRHTVELGGNNDLSFLLSPYVEEQQKANEAIQLQLTKTLNDFESMLTGLCDETYPIIFNTFKGVTKTINEVDEDDEDDETPVPAPVRKPIKKAKGVRKYTCPHGHIFGKDCECFEECDKCPLWEECLDANEELI
jgi:hypothetical protein